MNEDERQKNHDLAARLISEQNFVAALIAGAVAMFLAAWAYGIIVATWPFSHGFAAAGIGIFVGLSIRFLGRGISSKFANAASAFTIAGCLLGNLFRVLFQIMSSTAASPFDVLRLYPLPELAERSLGFFSLIDLVYWFVAVFCAAFLVKRPLSRSERLAVGLFTSKP